MSDLFLLSHAQMRRIRPFFPRSRGLPRVDDRRVVSGIVYVVRNGLRWKDAPRGYGPHKTLYNRFVRWSRLGVFARIFAELAAEDGPPERLMIDSTHLKAHRTAASLLKRGCSALHRAHQRGPELQAARGPRRTRAADRPAADQGPDERSQGRRADAAGAAAGPRADRRQGYDSDWFRAALSGRGIEPCIPSTRSRKAPLPYDKALYRERRRIENAFGRLKDWRRIAMRYDRCAHTFFSAICIAAAITFWL
jgi:transposase